MYLVPIHQHPEQNLEFLNHPLCKDNVSMTTDFYRIVGFHPPWIGYYAKQDEIIVGAAGFKGPPKEGTVEIAYGTFEEFRQKGVGTEMCRLLIELALRADSEVNITARTFDRNNFSTRILERNSFVYRSQVEDPEDGLVSEWIYQR